MKKYLGSFLLVALCTTGASFAEQAGAKEVQAKQSEADVERYMLALSDTRRRLFAESMSGLTASQLEAFWGVYSDYEKEKNELAAARVGLVTTFAKSFAGAELSDSDIDSAVRQMSTLQKQLVDLRLKYFDILALRIDTRAAGRFALTDDYISTSIRLDWLNQIPFPGDQKR